LLKTTTNYRKINLSCDKSYISKDKKEEVKKSKINLITPHRKNMKRKTNKRDKKHLKKRYTIENTIQTIKKYHRISIRRDKLMVTFKSFVYLATILTFHT
jgi:hypothetical protein